MPDERHGPPRKQSKLTWTIPLIFAHVLVALYFVWPASQASANEAYAALTSGEQARAEAWVTPFGAWGFVAILAFMLMQSLLAFIPSVLIMVVAVLACGPWGGGGLLAWGGLLLAASMAHTIGRLLGPVTVLVAYLGADVQRLESGLIWVSVISLLLFVGYVVYDRQREVGCVKRDA